MSALELQVYDIFKQKLGEKEAAIVIEYFEEKPSKNVNRRKTYYLQKKILTY